MNTIKKISSCVMKTFKFSLVLCTHENTDVFITLDDNIYGIHSKRVNILYVPCVNRQADKTEKIHRLIRVFAGPRWTVHFLTLPLKSCLKNKTIMVKQLFWEGEGRDRRKYFFYFSHEKDPLQEYTYQPGHLSHLAMSFLFCCLL